MSRSPRTLPPRRWYNSLWAVVRLLLVAYLLILLLMMFLENSLVFQPINTSHDDWQPAGLPREDAWFQAADGAQLHGWYVAHPRPRAIVLFCHGNAGNVTHRAAIMRDLLEYTGVSVLAFDYRGYGRSEGKPNEQGILADARAARGWLARRANVPESRIVMMGESLGGGVAVDLAAADGARALVLEDTFTSLPDVAAWYYPWLPVRWLMRNRLDSVAKIGRYHGPLLQSHGDCDTIIPLDFAQRLFAAANEPKQFLLIPGKDHNDHRPVKYYQDLAVFLEDGKPKPTQQ